MFEHQGLRLRKLARTDLPLLMDLKSESWFGTHQVSFLNLDDQLRWYESLGMTDRVFVAIESDQVIGLYKVMSIDWPNRSAAVGWDVFASHRGKGLGKRLVTTGSKLCFELLNLHRLSAEILETNIASQRCARSAGFIWEGCKRQVVQRHGRHFDSHVYGLLSTDFARQPRVNYVIAAWSGARRHMPPSPSHYLERHLQQLSEVPHSLAQITIVVPHNSAEPPEFSRCLSACPRYVQASPVVVLRRPNIGISYGSYSHAYSTYRTSFDYYIFMEDDYVLTQPHFDGILIEMFQQHPATGMVVGLVDGEGASLHGAIANGVSSADVLEEIWQTHEEIPFARHAATYDAMHQITFTRNFLIGGRALRDVTSRYQVAYSDSGHWRIYGDTTLPRFMEPISTETVHRRLRILILLLYHERPSLVRQALSSIVRADRFWPDWEMAFIDDRSRTPGAPIAEEVLGDLAKKVSFYRNLPEEYPEESVVGRTMNEAIQQSDAEIAIILGDDDELHPEYLCRLAAFFEAHPEEQCCYSHVHLYHPAWEKSDFVDNVTGPLNDWTEPMQLCNRVDASQVAWRTNVNKHLNIWFTYPRTACLDSEFFSAIGRTCGDAPYSGLIAQYKGVHAQQLIHHVSNPLGRQHDGPELRRATPLRDILALMDRYAEQGKLDAVEHVYALAREVYPAMDRVLKRRLQVARTAAPSTS